MLNRRTTLLGASILCALLPMHAASASRDIDDYLKKNLWGNLYKDGGKTYYCGKAFKKKTALLTETHIYTKSWIKDHLNCGSMRQCENDSPQFFSIATDLQNIVVSEAQIQIKLNNTVFGLLDDSVVKNACGIRQRMHLVEPPDTVKGDIARIMFYMHDKYNMPLVSSLPDLIRWSEIDPPSPEEIARNDKINAIQGNSNRFVTNPEQIYELKP